MCFTFCASPLCRRLGGHLDDVALHVHLPAVIEAAQPAFLVAKTTRRAGAGNIHRARTRNGRPRPIAGDYTNVLHSVKICRERLLAAGEFSAGQLDALVEALGEHLARPDTVVLDKLFFQAWGRRPIYPGTSSTERVRPDSAGPITVTHTGGHHGVSPRRFQRPQTSDKSAP